jgi:aminoglycoside/choline kinase family phosphotransferase
MNFSSFGAIFVDFSKARDLFVNIFQILGPNYKILGLWVDIGKTEGPKCKMSEIPRITNYFSTDKVVDWVHVW